MLNLQGKFKMDDTERLGKMRQRSIELAKDDVELATKFCNTSKFIRIALAITIVAMYFLESAWLVETLIVAVVFSLVFPTSFFDVFIQKLLEYNTQTLEERQRLNATEANKHFEKIYDKLQIKKDL